MERRDRRRIQRGEMAGIGSAPRGRKNYGIRGYAKSRDQKRGTRLRLRQPLFWSQRVFPDPYFFQASFRSRLNHPSPRAEALSKRRSAVFWFSSRRKVPQQIYNQIGRLTLSRKSARSPGREKAPFRRWSSLLTRLSKSCI